MLNDPGRSWKTDGSFQFSLILDQHTPDPMISLPGIYLKLGHFPVKIGLIRGVGGVPNFIFLIGISLLYYLGAHAKIQNSRTSLSRIYLKLADFPVKIGLNGGQGGSPNFFF